MAVFNVETSAADRREVIGQLVSCFAKLPMSAETALINPELGDRQAEEVGSGSINVVLRASDY
jgi:hypothetical protein